MTEGRYRKNRLYDLSVSTEEKVNNIIKYKHTHTWPELYLLKELVLTARAFSYMAEIRAERNRRYTIAICIRKAKLNKSTAPYFFNNNTRAY